MKLNRVLVPCASLDLKTTLVLVRRYLEPPDKKSRRVKKRVPERTPMTESNRSYDYDVEQYDFRGCGEICIRP